MNVFIFVPWFCSQLMTSIGPQYNAACNTAFNSSVQQDVQLYTALNIMQNDINQESNKIFNDIKNTITIEGVILLGAAYTYEYTKSISFSGPAKPLADSVSLSVNQTSGNVSLIWHF